MVGVLLVLVVFVVLVALNARGTGGCRWREDRAAATDDGARWRSAVCGAEGRTGRGPPRRCEARPCGVKLSCIWRLMSVRN